MKFRNGSKVSRIFSAPSHDDPGCDVVIVQFLFLALLCLIGPSFPFSTAIIDCFARPTTCSRALSPLSNFATLSLSRYTHFLVRVFVLSNLKPASMVKTNNVSASFQPVSSGLPFFLSPQQCCSFSFPFRNQRIRSTFTCTHTHTTLPTIERRKSVNDGFTG